MRSTSKVIAGAVVFAALGTGACSTDQPAVCDSFEAVQNSVDHIRNTNVAENGLIQLQTDLTQLRTNLQQLVADAQAQFASEAQAVQAAATQFSSSVTTARADPNAGNLAAVRPPMNALQTSVQALGDTMKGTC
jgi:flagellar capping protein FliD